MYENRSRLITPIRNDISVTFEFFPPKTDIAQTRLWECIDKLTPVGPNFVSVTYGADGSTRGRTHDTVHKLVTETGLKTAAHLTVAGASRAEIDEILDAYADMGVEHIVALRGDAPGNNGTFEPHPDGYANALELVEGIRKRHDFDISVAAYPEGHPDARSETEALDYLKAKIDAGANRAITQFFFDAETYLRFVDKARAAGITAPIVPGILPITDYRRTKDFADRCGTRVPLWIQELFKDLDDEPETRELVAAAIAVELCAELMEHGVRAFHFYTLNRAELTRAICRALRFRPARTSRLPRDRGSLHVVANR